MSRIDKITKIINDKTKSFNGNWKTYFQYFSDLILDGGDSLGKRITPFNEEERDIFYDLLNLGLEIPDTLLDTDYCDNIISKYAEINNNSSYYCDIVEIQQINTYGDKQIFCSSNYNSPVQFSFLIAFLQLINSNTKIEFVIIGETDKLEIIKGSLTREGIFWS